MKGDNVMTASNGSWLHAGRQLLTLCLERQGRYDEALDCLNQARHGKEDAHEDVVFAGQILAESGKWDEAVKLWLDVAYRKGLTKEIKRLCADCLLRASVFFSDNKEWRKALSCLGPVQKMVPDHPALKQLPEDMADAQSIVLFNIGDYKGAIDGWKNDLKSSGYKGELVHLMAIAYHAMLDSNADISLSQRLEMIEKANMCWVSLASSNSYWHEFYKSRREVFGERFTEDDFVGKISMVGPSRCETMLNELQASLDVKDKESIALVEETRLNMQVERHSATFFKENPPGGLQMARMVLGNDKVENKIRQLGRNAYVGSDGWFLVGLADKKTRNAFVCYLNGEYQACIEITSSATDNARQVLLGLALEKRIEVLLKGQHIRDCRYIAGILPKVKNIDIFRRVAKLFEEMVIRRCKDFLGERDRNEAVTFLQEILRLVRTGSASSRASFQKIEELLGSTLLQRSEERYNRGEIDGFIDDYLKASRLIKDKKVHEQHLKKIIKYHVTELFEKKEFSEVISFLEKLEKKLPENNILKAQKALMQGLWDMERTGGPISKSFHLFEKAYNYDPSDRDTASLYSAALANRGIETFNNHTPYNVRTAIQSAVDDLKRALEIDPSNDHARKNLRAILEMAIKAGIFL